jgi:translation elongation factor EF-Tu-like GTPase
MPAFRSLTTTLVLGLALTAAHAAERDAIASGAKLTKADAARTAPAVTSPSASDGLPADASNSGPGLSARGIEKKDIRRGMVIAKPGSIQPHQRSAQPAIECPPCDTLPRTPKSVPQD